MLWPEQVRGNDHGDRRLIRGRSRHNPVAAPQESDWSPDPSGQLDSSESRSIRAAGRTERDRRRQEWQASELARQPASEEAEQPPRFVPGTLLVYRRAIRKPERTGTRPTQPLTSGASAPRGRRADRWFGCALRPDFDRPVLRGRERQLVPRSRSLEQDDSTHDNHEGRRGRDPREAGRTRDAVFPRDTLGTRHRSIDGAEKPAANLTLSRRRGDKR